MYSFVLRLKTTAFYAESVFQCVELHFKGSTAVCAWWLLDLAVRRLENQTQGVLSRYVGGKRMRQYTLVIIGLGRQRQD